MSDNTRERLGVLFKALGERGCDVPPWSIDMSDDKWVVFDVCHNDRERTISLNADSCARLDDTQWAKRAQDYAAEIARGE